MSTVTLIAFVAPAPIIDCACSSGAYAVTIDHTGPAPIARLACLGAGRHTSCGWRSPVMPVEHAVTLAEAHRLARITTESAIGESAWHGTA